MSHMLPIEQASARLPELLRTLGPGDEIVLTQDDRQVARVLPSEPPPRRVAGRWKGKLTILSEDDEHLKEFKDYM
jgi:antitoxin (DNA-binding transcriptional repressor) of toxin-antitoxin stability system